MPPAEPFTTATIRRALAVTALAALAACTDPTTARRVLDGAGYSDIAPGGWALFGCSKDDMFATKFDAKGPTGRHVRGVVCSAWFKGATVRTFEP